MDKIIIVDFGSQYTQLIARRIRELGVYSFIVPPDKVQVEDSQIKGIILSGGPMSVYDKKSPGISKKILNSGIPILGICYGLQLISHLMEGKVKPSKNREYGFAKLKLITNSPLFKGIKKKKFRVWMSHGDSVTKLPSSFKGIAKTEGTPYAAVEKKNHRIFGVQFHPEVVHTTYGKKILHNFVFEIAGANRGWSLKDFIQKTITDLRENCSDKPVVCALSGGVDSSVLAEIVNLALPESFYPIFVDTGLLKKGEKERISLLFKHLKNLRIIDASNQFLNTLKGIEDPEKKRKIIGKTFIDMFIREARRITKRKKGKIAYLAQGTLYPDVIESRPFVGPSVTIKTHHNVGGLPTRHPFIIVEPFRELFKDEVRKIGKELGLSEEIIYRHPFPGPGLAVRIIGTINRKKIKFLQSADKIFEEEIRRAGLYKSLWQSFCVLLPCKSVGVMGDARTYEYIVSLRAVKSKDGMTADWARLPGSLLDRVARRIIGEIRGINRVVYDITSKPPSTIEWE